MSTEVLIQGSSSRPLYRKLVRDGVEGNTQVLFEMVLLIRDSVSTDVGLENFAAGILTSAGLDSYSSVRDQFERVFDFVKSHIIYVQDVAGRLESLKSARITLGDGYGDCDDQAILNASLLGCLGFEDVRIAMARYEANTKNFQHVYCVAYDGQKRYVFDTTLPDAKLDQEVKALEVREASIFGDDVKGVDGVSGWWNNLKHYTRKTTRAAITLAPQAGAVLPLGFLADSAWTTGIGMVEGATGNNTKLSLPATGSSINKKLDEIIDDLMQTRIAYDQALIHALKHSSELLAYEVGDDENYTASVVKNSVKQKLKFIKNFPAYAKANNIKCVNLHSGMMLAAGVALAASAGYGLYKRYRGNN